MSNIALDVKDGHPKPDKRTQIEYNIDEMEASRAIGMKNNIKYAGNVGAWLRHLVRVSVKPKECKCKTKYISNEDIELKIMKRINKNIGAKVQVREITVEINPQVKWKKLKKVTGVIVENEGYEHYYHTCSGGYTHVSKHLIENDYYPNFAIKLDNNVKDIEGNNVIVSKEFEMKFLERIEIPKKPVSEKAYLNAKKVIDRYESENGL